MASAPMPELPEKGKKKAARAEDHDPFKMDDFPGSRPEMVSRKPVPLFIWFVLLGLVVVAAAVYLLKRFM